MLGSNLVLYLRVTSIEPSREYHPSDVVCNIYHRNQLVAEVVNDDLDNTFKIRLKNEAEKISFELRSLALDDRVLGTASFNYDFIRHAQTGREYFQKIYLSPLGDDNLTSKDWGRDTTKLPCIEIGIEVDEPENVVLGNEVSVTSRNVAPHYNDEQSYLSPRTPIASEKRYLNRAEPYQVSTTLYRDKRQFSPTREIYDTGVRIDGTQQSIVKKQVRARSTRHGDVGREIFDESVEVRGTRPSKFAKVRSSRSIQINKDTPQHREQLKVILKRLISSLDTKHDDLVKDTENRMKILDWLFKNKSQYDKIFAAGGSDISDQQTLVSDVDREYSEVYKLDQDDIYALKLDLGRLKDELAASQRNLEIIREKREELLRFFGTNRIDDLEILEEEIEEDETGRQTSKRVLNRYIRRTDREVQEIRDENQSLYKELEGIRNDVKQKILLSQSKGIGSGFDDIFKGIQMKLNGVIGAKDVQNETYKTLNGDFIGETERNLDLKRKKIETENEVSTLREFIANDRELKMRLEDASVKSKNKGGLGSSTPVVQKNDMTKKIFNLAKEKQDLERQLKGNMDRIQAVEGRTDFDGGKIDGLDRLFTRFQNSLKQRNDLHSNILRSASSQVQTIDLKSSAKIGSSVDDKKVEDLLDTIESKEKEINNLLDLKEEAERKRRVVKKKNELSFNLNKDITEIEKKVKEVETERDRLKIDSKSGRNLDVELSNKEGRIDEQEQEIERLNSEIDKLTRRVESEPGPSVEIDDEAEREIEVLQRKLNDLNRLIDSSKRRGGDRDAERKRKSLREKEEYILELQRKLDNEEIVVTQTKKQSSRPAKVDDVDDELQAHMRSLN